VAWSNQIKERLEMRSVAPSANCWFSDLQETAFLPVPQTKGSRILPGVR
jgi:hypothetical protein